MKKLKKIPGEYSIKGRTIKKLTGNIYSHLYTQTWKL